MHISTTSMLQSNFWSNSFYFVFETASSKKDDCLKLKFALIWDLLYQQQTHTRRLHIGNDWQQNSQIVDEEIQLGKHSNNPIQATTHDNAGRHCTQLLMDTDIKGHSHWFAGKWNNVAEALSQDGHRNYNRLTSILHCHFPKQMPKHFKIATLPNKISSWLASVL